MDKKEIGLDSTRSYHAVLLKKCRSKFGIPANKFRNNSIRNREINTLRYAVCFMLMKKYNDMHVVSRLLEMPLKTIYNWNRKATQLVKDDKLFRFILEDLRED